MRIPTRPLSGTRRARLVSAVSALFLALLVAVVAQGSEKKGIGLTRCLPPQEASDRADALNLAWYYNWSPFPSLPQQSSREFVPMIWGMGERFPEHLAAVEGARHLLAFNEPDHGTKQFIAHEEVVRIWPKLAAAATRIGSPAPARALGPWMRSFMDRAKAENLKVDFVAVHWYGPPNAERLMRFLERVHKTYDKPIWITEFAVADWHTKKTGRKNRFGPKTVLQFMKESIPRLERMPYVERYAWFGTPCTYKEAFGTSLLFGADGKPTELGITYAGF